MGSVVINDILFEHMGCTEHFQGLFTRSIRLLDHHFPRVSKLLSLRTWLHILNSLESIVNRTLETHHVNVELVDQISRILKHIQSRPLALFILVDITLACFRFVVGLLLGLLRLHLLHLVQLVVHKFLYLSHLILVFELDSMMTLLT